MNIDNTIVISNTPVTTTPSYKEFINSSKFTASEVNRGSIYVPTCSAPLPTAKNYQDGYMLRYFYKSANNIASQVKETNYSEYQKTSKYFLYKTAIIKWKLIGTSDSVSSINKNIISMANSMLPGISNTLINPLQYWKNVPDTSTPLVNVTLKYVTPQTYEKQYSIIVPSTNTTDDTGIYLLTQDSFIIYTQDGYGILVEDNT
jgi:hypothetical protein